MTVMVILLFPMGRSLLTVKEKLPILRRQPLLLVASFRLQMKWMLSIDLSNISGISSASAGSTLKLDLQDGSDPGTLSSFVIDETGIINGVFDNGIIRTLGQVTLARFSNPQGLLESGNSTFQEGVSSGPPFPGDAW